MRKTIVSTLFLGVAVSAFGAEAGNEVTQAGLNWVLGAIPLAVPILVALGKKLIPAIPSLALPIVATALGVGIDQLAALATAHESNLLLSAVFGSAGVGLREIVDQIKQKLG